MAKGRTPFVCIERKIGKGQWRWSVTLWGECLGSGIAKTQSEARQEKDRVKDEQRAKEAAIVKTPVAPTTHSWKNWSCSSNRARQ